MAGFLTNRGATELGNGGTAWLSSTLKAMLLNNSFTPLRTHNTVSDINANELSGTGYTGGFNGSGRITLGTKTVTENDSSNRVEFSMASLAWTGINAGTIRWVAIIREITNDAASPIIGYLESASFPLVTNGGNVTLTIPSGGAFQLNT